RHHLRPRLLPQTPLGNATAPSPQDFGSGRLDLAPLARPRLALTPLPLPFPLTLSFFFHLPAALCPPHIPFKFPVTEVKKGGQHFTQSSSRPALSSIRSASVDRRCAGQLALHTASTVHCSWTTSLGPSGLEYASESKSEVTEAPQICRLCTLKMRASSFTFMRDSSLPQQWVVQLVESLSGPRERAHDAFAFIVRLCPFFSLFALCYLALKFLKRLHKFIFLLLRIIFV
ncbi:hypothetical protein BC826DRAFT_649954, partial [Russula brevipes]